MAGDADRDQESLPGELTQGTPEWLMARVGKLTASRLTPLYSTRASSMRDLAREIVGERATGLPHGGSFTGTTETEWGKKHEPTARAVYEHREKVKVREVGLIVSPHHPLLAASPDGLVLDKRGRPVGLLEIKCPSTKKVVKWIDDHPGGQGCPPDYQPQMLHQLLCCVEMGLTWVDFVSLDPRVPPSHPFYYRRWRFTPSREQVSDHVKRCLHFIGIVKEIEEKCLT
jgi:putative phage-type endonuclease